MVTTRGGEHHGSSTCPKALANQPVTELRRSKRSAATTPGGTLDSPDHVLSLQFDSAAATKPVENKSRSRISRAPSTRKKAKLPSKPVAEINATLTPSCLIEFFKRCDNECCLKVLPLVCKHWRDILRAPSAAWENLTISNGYANDYILTLDFGKILKWVTPRAKGIANLTIEYEAHGQGEESKIAAENFSVMLKAVSQGTLQSLVIHPITHRGFGFDLKWSVLKDISGAAKTLTTLCLDSIDDGHLLSEHVEILKSFKKLEHLRLIQKPFVHLSPDDLAERRQGAPEGTPPLPSNLFDLTQLKSLSLVSELITGSLSKDLQRLENLTELQLSGTNLKKIGALPKNLKELSLTHSTYGQQIIDNGFWSLLETAACLTKLDLCRCNIKRLKPLEFEDYFYEVVEPIKELNLSCNPLGSLGQSDLMFCMVLDTLDLSYCGLSFIPDMMPDECYRLKSLKVNGNNLVDLPREMENMTSLKVFSAENNNFPTIPEVLKSMKSLTHINLSFSTYMEISKSISEWLLGSEKLEVLGLMKADRYQTSSISWLQKAERELAQAGKDIRLTYNQKPLKTGL